jgi:TfoX/Sxy family transcriptional regulator of competence genes
MATWKKPDAALVQALLDALRRRPGIEHRQMFGCPSAFVGGHLFACVHEDRLVVRIPSEAARRPFAPMGRAMKEYAAVEGALDLPGREFEALVARALDYASGLPPKVSRNSRPKKADAPDRSAA